MKNVARHCQRSVTSHLEPEIARDNGVFLLTNIAMPLENLYAFLIDEIKFNKKTCTRTTKCEIIKLLGLLICAFPHDASSNRHIRSIIDYCLEALRQNFSAKDPDVSIIASCFSCLDRCCHDYEGDVFTAADTKPKLLEYLVKAVSSANQEDVTRFAFARKALRFLQHHASLFQDQIGLHAQKVYIHTFDCLKANKEVLKKHAEDAFLAVVCEISRSLAKHCESGSLGITDSGDPAASSKISILEMPLAKTLQSIVETFLRCIERSDSSPSDVALAVKAFAAMATGVAWLEYLNAFSGDISIVKTLVRSSSSRAAQADASALADDGSAVGGAYRADSSGRQVVHALLAVGAVVEASLMVGSATARQLDAEVLQWINEMAIDVIFNYSRLMVKTQVMAQQALIMCAQALEQQNDVRHTSNFIGGFLDRVVSAAFIRTLSRKERGEGEGNSSGYRALTVTLQEGGGGSGSSEVGGDVAVEAGAAAGDTVAAASSIDSEFTPAETLVVTYLPLWRELFEPQNRCECVRVSE